ADRRRRRGSAGDSTSINPASRRSRLANRRRTRGESLPAAGLPGKPIPDLRLHHAPARPGHSRGALPRLQPTRAADHLLIRELDRRQLRRAITTATTPSTDWWRYATFH